MKPRKCKQPKMAEHRGRTWDYMAVKWDGLNLKGWFDTSWGRRVYFERGGQWYWMPVMAANADASLMVI